MHDQHRDKRDLIIELTDLRKQVADLKHSAAERRRIEDGLRRESELLRTLVDTAPATLCLRLPARELLIANHAFANLLGYGSAGELVRIARELGLFASGYDQGWLSDESQGKTEPVDVGFRTKDGSTITLPVIRTAGSDPNLLALAVFEPARENRRAG